MTDKEIIDWVETHPRLTPSLGRDGQWYVRGGIGGRETWAWAATFRDAVRQVMTGTGPEPPDRDAVGG